MNTTRMARRRCWRTGGWIILLGTSFGPGCVSDPQGNDQPSVEEITAPLSIASWWDNAGRINVHLFQCDWRGPAAVNTAFCSVSSDLVLVGGGAELKDVEDGALLTGSEPLNWRTWRAASKQHNVADSHSLRAYALGMKIIGSDGNFIPAGTLSTLMMYRVYARSCDGQCPDGQPPSASALTDLQTYAPPGWWRGGDIALGGGAWVYNGGNVEWQEPPGSPTSQVAWNPRSAGQLLTLIAPDTWNPAPAFWSGVSKDHGVWSPDWIETAAIGIHRCSNLISDGCLVGSRDQAAVNVASGYGSAGVNMTAGYAMTSIGGWADYRGAGRMLTGLVPVFGTGRGGARVQDKDHVWADTGTLNAYSVGLRFAPGRPVVDCSCDGSF